MKTYTVSVNFGGYIGCDEEYKVDASSEEEVTIKKLKMFKINNLQRNFYCK